MHVKQALENLVKNGCKLEHYKGGPKYVHIRSKNKGGLSFWSAVDCVKQLGWIIVKGCQQ